MGNFDRQDLLVMLDACVHREPPAAGLRGEICIGIRGRDRVRWLRVKLGRATLSGFVASVPHSADVVCVLSEEQARALVDFQPLPEGASALELHGDRDLLMRFFERCITSTSWIDVRHSFEIGHDRLVASRQADLLRR